MFQSQRAFLGLVFPGILFSSIAPDVVVAGRTISVCHTSVVGADGGRPGGAFPPQGGRRAKLSQGLCVSFGMGLTTTGHCCCPIGGEFIYGGSSKGPSYITSPPRGAPVAGRNLFITL